MNVTGYYKMNTLCCVHSHRKHNGRGSRLQGYGRACKEHVLWDTMWTLSS